MSNHDEISTLFARFIRNYQINNAEDARGPDYETRKYIYLLQQLRNKDSKVLVVDYEDLVDVADIYIEGKGISKYQAIIQMLKIKPDKAIKALSEGAFHVLQEVQPDYADDIGNDLRVAIRGVFYNIDISRISDEHVGRLVQISGIFTRPSPSTQYICSEGHNIRVKSKGSSDYGVKTGDYVSATGIIRMEKQANSLGKFYMQALWIEVKPEFYERHRNQLQLKCGDEGTSTYITWSQQDQKILQREYRKGATLRQLSELLMRDVNSVRDKIFNLGLKRKHEELVDKKRVGHLDVEASQLFGDFGFTLSWAIKESAGEIIGDK
jgi:ribosomal protein S13